MRLAWGMNLIKSDLSCTLDESHIHKLWLHRVHYTSVAVCDSYFIKPVTVIFVLQIKDQVFNMFVFFPFMPYFALSPLHDPLGVLQGEQFRHVRAIYGLSNFEAKFVATFSGTRPLPFTMLVAPPELFQFTTK